MVRDGKGWRRSPWTQKQWRPGFVTQPPLFLSAVNVFQNGSPSFQITVSTASGALVSAFFFT